MIIDFHTHTFPEKIYKSAMAHLKQKFGNLEPFYDGSLSGLRSYADENPVDYYVILNIATNAKQQVNVNNFAAEANHGRIISFGSVFPDAPDASEELNRIKSLGLKGIKLHPDYQSFFIDDPRYFPLYRRIGELGLITVFHAGQDMGCFEPVHCTPKMLASILPLFNGAPVIAAHMGGNCMWYDVEKHLVGKDIYFDTAFTYGNMPLEHAKRITKNHEADKILLGSDMPWSRTTDEIKYIKSWGLTDIDLRKVLGENAAALLFP